MEVVRTLARSTATARRAALGALVALVALGLAACLGALALADRTHSAYGDYLRRSEVADVVINASMSTDRAAELIAEAPGAGRIVTDDLLTATLDDGAPRSQQEIDSEFLQVRASADGRYAEQDRPSITDGRMVQTGREVFLNEETAAELGAEVGDELPIAFWLPSYLTGGVGPGREELVEPLGRDTVTVVGIGTLADEVLPDELYPRSRAIITMDVGRPYTCTIGDPTAVEPDLPVEEMFAALVPDDCALSYRYFSVDVEGGPKAVNGFVDHLYAAFEEENGGIPPALRELDVGYFVIPTLLADEELRVAQALQPSVRALQLLGLAAALATLVLLGLVALRLARRDPASLEVWRQLGATRGQRTGALAIPIGTAVVVGVLLAVPLAWVVSGIGPIGSATGLGDDGRRLPVGVVVPGVLVALGAGLIVVGLAAQLAARRPTDRPDRSSALAPLARRLSPSSGAGVRAAASATGAGAVLVGGVLAISAVTAAGVFSASLSSLLSDPARFGWPTDAAVIIGFGYGGADGEAIAADLDRPEVTAWDLATLGTVTIDEEPLPMIAPTTDGDAIAPPVLAGRLPAGDDEVAVGRQTLDDLSLAIGDEVDIVTPYGDRAAEVTGVVVLPAIGQYGSDRSTPGRGMWASQAWAAAVIADFEAANGLPPGAFAANDGGALVGIDLADGVEPETVLPTGADLVDWDRNGFESPTYPQAVRPPALIELTSMDQIPRAIGGAFALAMASGLALGVALATRARRRELAILRALGCTTRQRASSVHWHALTVVVLATAGGVPLGVALGRVASRAFLAGLGVADDPVVPPALVVLVVLGALAVGLLAALPARQEIRRAARVLREA